MKIIIYALGKIFEEYKERVDWNQVVALADKNNGLFHNMGELPVISPGEINNLEYDFIAVFSSVYFEEIRMELIGEYFVPQDKIIPWKEIIVEKNALPKEVLQSCLIFLEHTDCSKILDFGMSTISKYYMAKKELFHREDIRLDGIWSDKAICNVNLYDHVYEKWNLCDQQYDAILLWKELQYSDFEWEQMRKQTRFILFHTNYLENEILLKKTLGKKLEKYGSVKSISTINGLFWIVDTKEEKLSADITIYVAIHRDYNLQSNCFYKPLCVGHYRKKGYLTEQSGSNIAYLNSKINECTALYWIWKNVNAKYVGLNHYRRYFYTNEIKSVDNFLNLEEAVNILEKYDIILPIPFRLEKSRVFEQIKDSMDQALFEKAYALFKSKIRQKQPDYLEQFEDVMNGYNAFLCNMFVTKFEILNQYCEWLFSFLIEAAEEINVEEYNSYSQRVIGFFAERMWTVWLRKNRLKIKELPYVLVR